MYYLFLSEFAGFTLLKLLFSFTGERLGLAPKLSTTFTAQVINFAY